MLGTTVDFSTAKLAAGSARAIIVGRREGDRIAVYFESDLHRVCRSSSELMNHWAA